MKTLTMKKLFLSLSLLAAPALTAGLVACAAEVGDINRVQPDAYAKSIFDGEWYVRPTVIRTQYHQGQTFEGLEGAMDKVRWEVQEKKLIAWRSYEYIPNSEPNPGSHTPIAIFDILSHFEIKREYNPSNGAESNVLVENTTDKPWWERPYFRVDWSRNLVSDFDIAGFVNDSSIGVLAVNDTGDRYDPYRPRIGNDYVDVVTRARLRPDEGSAWDYSLVEVNEVDIRWSFRKIAEKAHYDPLLYPDFLPVKVRYRYAQKAINGKWLPCDPGPTNTDCKLYTGAPSSGDPDSCASARETATPGWVLTRICHPDTTAEQDCFCQQDKQDLWVDSSGNICDSRVREQVDPEDCTQITYPVFERFGFFRTLRMPFDWEREFTFNGRIYLANRWNIWERSVDDTGAPIPYADRKPKTITYYTNPEFPPELVDVAGAVALDWNRPFKQTVASLQGLPVEQVPDMFVLHPNDCNIENVRKFAADHDLEKELDDAVGGPALVALGNLTRACTALEVATEGRDESERFVWQRTGDLRYSFMNWVHTPQQAGPLGFGPSAADPETGEIINANANIYGAGVDTYANFAADMVQLLNGEVPVDQFADGDNVVAEITRGRSQVNQGLSKRSTKQLMQRVADLDLSDPDGYLTQLPSRNDINRADPRSMTALADQNSRLNAMGEFAQQNLVTEEMLRAFAGPGGYQPGQQATPEAMQQASPSTWGRFPDVAQRLAPLAKGFRTQDETLGVLDREARRERFFAEHNIEYGSMLVEPAVYGLALSLRGKPRPEVVQYARRQILLGVMLHEVGHTLGLRHNFSGSSDALNFQKEFWTLPDAAEDPATRKWDHAYSSIMDYHQRFNSDWSGIGPYDEAAIRFGYGQLLDTFDRAETDFYPEDNFGFATSVLDYKDLPKILGGNGATTDEAINQAYYAAQAGTSDVMTLPASLPANVDNMYRRKPVPFGQVYADYLDSIYGKFAEDGSYDGKYLTHHKVVPYQFCSDAYAWGGNLMCNRYDMGANVQEVVDNARTMYESYYLFNNFRRDRYTFLGGPGNFAVGGYLNRIYSRIFQPMLNAYRYFYYYRRSSYMMFPLVVDWASGAFNGLNFFMSVLQKPEPGRYCLQSNLYVPALSSPGSCTSPIELGVGEGRYFNSRWTDEYYYKADRIGSYWDKWLATVALTDSQFFLVRNYSSLFDRGALSITYYRVFEQEMAGLFRSLAQGDLGGMNAGVQQDPATGQYQVLSRPLVGEDPATWPAVPQIQAAMTWSLQKQAAFYAVVGFTSSVDRRLDFARRARISYQGSSEDPVYEGFRPDQVLDFTDPLTHLVYRAAPVGTVAGEVDTEAPGYAMVRTAKTFLEQSWMPSQQHLTDADTALAEAKQSGNAAAIATAQAARDAAAEAFSAADQQLRRHVDLLEYMRLLGHFMHLYMD